MSDQGYDMSSRCEKTKNEQRTADGWPQKFDIMVTSNQDFEDIIPNSVWDCWWR